MSSSSEDDVFGFNRSKQPYRGIQLMQNKRKKKHSAFDDSDSDSDYGESFVQPDKQQNDSDQGSDNDLPSTPPSPKAQPAGDLFSVQPVGNPSGSSVPLTFPEHVPTQSEEIAHKEFYDEQLKLAFEDVVAQYAASIDPSVSIEEREPYIAQFQAYQVAEISEAKGEVYENYIQRITAIDEENMRNFESLQRGSYDPHKTQRELEQEAARELEREAARNVINQPVRDSITKFLQKARTGRRRIQERHNRNAYDDESATLEPRSLVKNFADDITDLQITASPVAVSSINPVTASSISPATLQSRNLENNFDVDDITDLQITASPVAVSSSSSSAAPTPQTVIRVKSKQRKEEVSPSDHESERESNSGESEEFNSAEEADSDLDTTEVIEMTREKNIKSLAPDGSKRMEPEKQIKMLKQFSAALKREMKADERIRLFVLKKSGAINWREAIPSAGSGTLSYFNANQRIQARINELKELISSESKARTVSNPKTAKPTPPTQIASPISIASPLKKRGTRRSQTAVVSGSKSSSSIIRPMPPRPSAFGTKNSDKLKLNDISFQRKGGK